MHSVSRYLSCAALAVMLLLASVAQNSSSGSSSSASASPSQDTTQGPDTGQSQYPPDKPDKNAPAPSTMNNIDAIGNRNVGCNKGVGNWYSLDKQVAMGRSYSQQVEHGAKMVTDPMVTEYVNRIGQNLVRNSDAKVPFTIKVIDTDELNAFALPGGFFYVNSGRSWPPTTKLNWPESWRMKLRT